MTINQLINEFANYKNKDQEIHIAWFKYGQMQIADIVAVDRVYGSMMFQEGALCILPEVEHDDASTQVIATFNPKIEPAYEE